VAVEADAVDNAVGGVLAVLVLDGLVEARPRLVAHPGAVVAVAHLVVGLVVDGRAVLVNLGVVRALAVRFAGGAGGQCERADEAEHLETVSL
jgi:hypothetical protein